MSIVSSRFTVAVHILALLAIEGKNQPTTSEYLAHSVGTNPVVIRRIIAMLGKAGLLVAHGSREPSPYCICGRSLEPVINKVFQQVEIAMEKVLAGITIAQIAEEVEETDTLSHNK